MVRVGFYKSLIGRVFGEGEAKAILEQVVSGLLYLHGHGIMHRDLTLANLLLTRDMRVKIADFGLATRLTGQPNERHVTMCGTPNYHGLIHDDVTGMLIITSKKVKMDQVFL